MVLLNDLLREVGTGSLGLYAPLPGNDPYRDAMEGIGGDGLPYAVRTVDVGAGAAGCAVADVEGALARLTGLAPGGLVAVRPDLYCAGILPRPDADAEALLARSVAFLGA